MDWTGFPTQLLTTGTDRGLDNLIHSYTNYLGDHYRNKQGTLTTSRIARDLGVNRTKFQYLLQRPKKKYEHKLISSLLSRIHHITNQKLTLYAVLVKNADKYGAENASPLTFTYGVLAVKVEGAIFPIWITGNSDSSTSDFLLMLEMAKSLSAHTPNFISTFVTNAPDEKLGNEVFNHLPTGVECIVSVRVGEPSNSNSRDSIDINELKSYIRVRRFEAEVVKNKMKTAWKLRVQNGDENAKGYYFYNYFRFLFEAESNMSSLLSKHFSSYRGLNGTKNNNIGNLSRLALLISISKISVGYFQENSVSSEWW